MFSKYIIKDTDNFDELLYPGVATEVDGLKHRLLKFRSADKTRIVISMLKDHCIETTLLDGNKELTRLLTSGSLATSGLESLFESSKGNLNFRNDLETYITAKLR